MVKEMSIERIESMEADIQHLQHGHSQLESAVNRMVESQNEQTDASRELTKSIGQLVTETALSNQRADQMHKEIEDQSEILKSHSDRISDLEKSESGKAGAISVLKWAFPFVIIGVVVIALTQLARLPSIG